MSYTSSPSIVPSLHWVMMAVCSTGYKLCHPGKRTSIIPKVCQSLVDDILGATETDSTGTTLGLISASLYLPKIPVLPFLSWIVDRWGRKTCLVSGFLDCLEPALTLYR